MKFFLATFLLLIGFACAVTELRQEDFVSGTLQLSEPGTYVLAEDITFNPNSAEFLGVEGYNSGDPLPSQFTFAGGPYDPSAFGIGFFAAITIIGDGITLDLNGHTFQQSKEHALQQKFYSHVELADRPFVPAEGPHDFGMDTMRTATNVVIKNGRFARSSHHAIHGNGAINVTISDLIIEDYEVAAIALNGVKGASITDVIIRNTRRDVAALGTWSSARFLRRFADYLADTGSATTLRIQGVEHTAAEIRDNLRTAMNNVFDDVVTKDLGFIDSDAHPDEFSVFHNEFGMLDGGACYGLLLNHMGNAVLGFPVESEDEQDLAQRVLIENVIIDNINLAPNEIEMLSDGHGGVVVDPIGAAFQLRRLSPLDGTPVTTTSLDENEAEYTGSVVSNVQAFVAKAIMNGDFEGTSMDVSRSAFPDELIQWVEATPGTPEAKLAPVAAAYPWVCNGDAMFHVNKGIIGMKMDASEQTTIRNVRVSNLRNHNPDVGSDICDYDQASFSHPDATLPGFGANVVRGISVAGSFDLVFDNVEVSNLQSDSGSVFGINILTDAHLITCNECSVSGLVAGAAHELADYPDSSPTEPPRSVGFFVEADARDIMLQDVTVSDLSALASTAKFELLGNDVFVAEAESSSASSSSTAGSSSSSDSSSSSSDGSFAHLSLIAALAMLVAQL